MDPNLFHLDWERTIEALMGIVVLSFFVERACAVLFESRWWISRFQDARVSMSPPNEDNAAAAEIKPPKEKEKLPAQKPLQPLPGQRYPLKEFLAFALAFVICLQWDFDAVSIIMLSEKTQLYGVIITAAVVAGGSKGSVALFHNLLKIQSTAVEEKRRLNNGNANA